MIFSNFQIEKSKFTKRKNPLATSTWKEKKEKNEQLYNGLNKHILSYKLQNVISSKTNSDLNNKKTAIQKDICL